DANKVCR
ncbi:hypothetical protein CP8484711_0588B, partial [Chlamydia psittaci 84-8471/1]